MACRACGATPTLGGARSGLGVPRRGAIEAMQGGGAAQEVGCEDGGEATGPIVAPSSSSSDNVGRTFPSCGGGVVSPNSSRPRARRVGAHPAVLESISAKWRRRSRIGRQPKSVRIPVSG